MTQELATIGQGIALLPQEIEQQITAAFDRFKDYAPTKLEDAAQEVVALELFTEIKTLNKSLKELQLSITRPIEAKADEVRARFKSALTVLNNAQHQAERSILVYRQEVARKLEVQRQIQQAELDRIAKEKRERLLAESSAEKVFGDDVKAQELAIEADSIEAATVGTVENKPEGERVNYIWELEDIKLVPDAYKMVNEKMINAIVKSGGKSVSIPGIKVKPKPSVVLQKGRA